MIFYLVTARHSYAIEFFLQLWAPEVRRVLSVVSYEQVMQGIEPSSGIYLFTDLDRLTSSQASTVGRFHDRLKAMSGVDVLNPPDRALGRYDLLHQLYRAGMNEYRAFRLSEVRHPPRFPVFIKPERGHGGRHIELLRTQDEFERSITRRWLSRSDLRGLLVIEFCDTRGQDHAFRKYSAFVIGDQVIPRHVFRSDHWVVKQADLVDEESIQEELEYLETNPHEQQIRELAKLGGFGYGRIDYSLRDGRVQVWEFNTNPVIFSPKEHFHAERLRTQQMVARKIAQGFQALAESRAGTEGAGHARPSEIFRPPTLSGAGRIRYTLRGIGSIRRGWLSVRKTNRSLRKGFRVVMTSLVNPLRPWVLRRLEKTLWGA